MLIPTSSILLENKKKDKNIQMLNTVKIDFSKLSAIKPGSEYYTQCSKCFMLLTVDDSYGNMNNSFITSSSNSQTGMNKDSHSQNLSNILFRDKIYENSQKRSNFTNENHNMSKINKLKVEQMSQVSDDSKSQEKSEKINRWFCRYCKEQNFSSQKIFYAPNNYKCVIRKNISRNILPPLLLFVIDQSGSMGETISVDAQNSESSQKHNIRGYPGNSTCSNQKHSKLIKLSKQINQMINKSFFYKKTASQDKKELLEFYDIDPNQQKKDQKSSKKNYYSKITFFMAVIEDYISRIKCELNTEEFRVGFIFFNQSILILKPSKQKFIPVFSPSKNKGKKEKNFPFDQKYLNFDNFQSLYKEGQRYDRYFGDCRLKNLDFSKLQFQNLKTEGQTSLGPALVFSLGILSVHDIGSRIIIISDAKPNNGILADQVLQVNQANYQKIGEIIKQRQISLGVLTWVEEGNKGNSANLSESRALDQITMQFEKFLKEYDRTLIQQIILDFSIGFSQYQILQKAKKTLIGLIKRGSLGKALKVDIRSDNPSIKIEKFKYDHIDFRFIKFLSAKNKNWIQMHAFKPKQSDFLFPIYTQVVIRYEDVFTKEQCLFMSYCSHKLSQTVPKKLMNLNGSIVSKKSSVEEESEVQFQFLQTCKQQNLRQLQSLQYINNFNYDKVIPEAYSSKMDIYREDDNNISSLQFDNTNNLNKLADNINSINNDQDQEIYL